MDKGMSVGSVLSACLAVVRMGLAPDAYGQEGKGLRVVSDGTVRGFAFPESVGCDPNRRLADQ
jgi:hypothetical protein